MTSRSSGARGTVGCRLRGFGRLARRHHRAPRGRGQAGSSSMIENYMGFPRGIAGAELAERARQQAVKFGIELLMMQEGVRGEFHDNRIWVDLADGSIMVARANICATGVEWR